MEDLRTECVHGGESPELWQTVAPPLYQTASFEFHDLDAAGRAFSEREGYAYSRLGNPTVALLERRMARLEGAEEGAAFASGMGALSSTLLAHLNAGDHVLASEHVYGCTYALLSKQLPRFGVEVTFADFTDLSAVRKAVRKNTKILFYETPGNPTMAIVDIRAIAEIAREAGALSVIDNTFATPVLQRPIEFGTDLVIHSATKYLSGHGDVLGGVTAGSNALIQPLRRDVLKDFGAVLSPFNAWLILRGLATLPLRVNAMSESAQRVAEFLATRPEVRRVAYPGFPESPGHAIAARQMRAFGGMIAFDLATDLEGVRRFLAALRLFKLAVSLGDVRSLIEHPWTMTHSLVPAVVKLRAGITESSLRISVGLEAPEDLIEDLEGALGSMKRVHTRA